MDKLDLLISECAAEHFEYEFRTHHGNAVVQMHSEGKVHCEKVKDILYESFVKRIREAHYGFDDDDFEYVSWPHLTYADIVDAVEEALTQIEPREIEAVEYDIIKNDLIVY
ncbi:hypothetical protein [Aeromonas veronii]|uniref:hypothetical protein n=1 Tax=Aeromonas veronii TaxID=654 RepID=UPI003BA207D8